MRNKRAGSLFPVIIQAVVVWEACHHSDGPPTAYEPGLHYSGRIDQSTFPGRWPVTSTQGVLGCDPTGAITAR